MQDIFPNEHSSDDSSSTSETGSSSSEAIKIILEKKLYSIWDIIESELHE